jgi:glutathione S-transferase
LGQSFSIADPYLFVVCTWLEGDGVSIADYPKIQNFVTNMEARKSVKTIREKAML